MKITTKGVQNELSRRKLIHFTRNTMPTFEANQFHEVYYELLDRFAKGEIKKLMVTVPPQHGKSEGSTRRLPAAILGHKPNTKIAVASYAGAFAMKFNRDVQRIIDTPEYYDIFPSTTLNQSNVVTVSSSYLRNSTEFEIVNHLGGLKAVGRGGALTGNQVDVMIMDDLYKDFMEGNSPTIRDAVWDWYTTVVKTRLHNDSQELIVFTRWHEEDLIGRLEKKENVVTINSLDELEHIKPSDWVKINFAAIKEGDPTDIDQREAGEPLWPERHNLDKLNEARSLDVEKFNCLYQGQPESAEGLLYKKFKTYQKIPEGRIVKNYTDTADTGNDYLCSVNYLIPLDSTDDNIYILDVYYSQEPMEVTEPATIMLLDSGDVNESDVESNNGGRGFARVVQAGCSGRCTVNWFHQSKNKESRIFSTSATVNRRIVFPNDWHVRWPDFHTHITKYKKLFKANKHDDGVDVLTGIIEKSDHQEAQIIW